MRLRSAVPLLLIAALAAGCGAEDAARDSAEDAVKDVSGFNDAIERCKNEAEKINDDNARGTALEACEAAEQGDVDAPNATEAAREQCLERARDVNDPGAREQAEQACNDIK